MSQITQDGPNSHKRIILGGTCLGLVLALAWVTAAHGSLELPREAIDWLSGGRPGSVSRLYDQLLFAILTCAAIVAALLLANVWAFPGTQGGHRRPRTRRKQ